MYNNLFAKQFEEDEVVKEEKKTSSSANTEYEFEGYTIEVNEKVMLTPITVKK
jgi:hypothetical protein